MLHAFPTRTSQAGRLHESCPTRRKPALLKPRRVRSSPNWIALPTFEKTAFMGGIRQAGLNLSVIREESLRRGGRELERGEMRTSGSAATRRSLVDRLQNWEDRKHWQEFFDAYWKLIFSAARRSGLTETEAEEVVQETVITVAKKVGQLRYDPARGSFKGWLLHITRWRIADQFRKRQPGDRARFSDNT